MIKQQQTFSLRRDERDLAPQSCERATSKQAFLASDWLPRERHLNINSQQLLCATQTAFFTLRTSQKRFWRVAKDVACSGLASAITGTLGAHSLRLSFLPSGMWIALLGVRGYVNSIILGHGCSVDHRLVSSRQNVCRLKIQSSG